MESTRLASRVSPNTHVNRRSSVIPAKAGIHCPWNENAVIDPEMTEREWSGVSSVGCVSRTIQGHGRP